MRRRDDGANSAIKGHKKEACDECKERVHRRMDFVCTTNKEEACVRSCCKVHCTVLAEDFGD